jgi:hypothetical protein
LSVFSCTAHSIEVQGHPPGPEAEQKFFTRTPQQCMDLTDLKKWTVRKTTADKNATFLVPLPIVSKFLVNVEIGAVAAARKQFPCRVKCIYKYINIIHRSGSIQTKPQGRPDRMMEEVLEVFERNRWKSGKKRAWYALM